MIGYSFSTYLENVDAFEEEIGKIWDYLSLVKLHSLIQMTGEIRSLMDKSIFSDLCPICGGKLNGIHDGIDNEQLCITCGFRAC